MSETLKEDYQRVQRVFRELRGGFASYSPRHRRWGLPQVAGRPIAGHRSVVVENALLDWLEEYFPEGGP